MRLFLTAYPPTLLAFLAVDAIWLSLMGPGFHKPLLGGMALERFSLAPAAVFYLLFGVGLVVFAVMPGVHSGRIGHAAAMGALFGLIAYATYDLTNMATLKGWPLSLTIVDMIWGTLASSLAAMIGTATTLFFAPR